MNSVQQNIEYKLAEGGSNERSVPLPTKMTLGGSWDITFGRLYQIHQALSSPMALQARPELATLIQAVWLTWCYVSHDITAIRTQLADAEHAAEESAKTQQQLAEKVLNLEKRLDALLEAP